MDQNIILLGVLFLGSFVGLVLGATLQLTEKVSAKLAAGIIGAALGGAPVLFMQGLDYQKWMYPIGLVVGLLWIRLLGARTVVGKRPRKAERVAWYLAWADTLVVLAVTAVVVASAALIDLRDGHQDEAFEVTRDAMPCRWAWVYLGRYSPSQMRFELGGDFRYVGRPGAPVPAPGDEIMLTRAVALVITNYRGASTEHKCDSILDPPWGYRPETASEYEAGQLPSASRVVVNQVTLMPAAQAEPAYVWALVGPRH